MITGLINKLTKLAKKNKRAAKKKHQHALPLIVPRSEHTISRRDISECALKVLYRLHKHGYEAYLVGGAVRDLLLGLKPKDFDVATNAKPEEVRALFRNCRLIGRRFRLAHVYFGDEIIEVATFRAKHLESELTQSHTSAGMIVNDNVYGTMEDDAWRRDFTVNALYYNIADFSIVDYTGGLIDLNAKQLSLIGEPEQRFREDPVRILRVIRFASKLKLKIDPTLLQPISQYAHLITSVSSARLFEEVRKLFHSGEGAVAFNFMQQFKLFEALFPFTQGCESEAFPLNAFLNAVFTSTDKRIQADKSVTPVFLFAAIFWYPLCLRAQALVDEGLPTWVAREKMMEPLFQAQLKTIGVPRRLLHAVRELLMLQMRMERPPSKKANRIVNEPRFRAAYDFIALRVEVGEPLDRAVSEWKRFYESEEVIPSRPPRKRRYKQRKPKTS